MNDRFKFRIFDKETGKYYKTRISKGSGCIVYQHPSDSHCTWVQIGTMFAELEQDEKTYANTGLEPDFIIEQCTGLKDKNGNLIYEGDIVEITIFGSIGSNGGYVDSDKIYKGAVVWDRDCFLAKTDIDMFLFPYSEDCIEIIGNIHKQAEQKE